MIPLLRSEFDELAAAAARALATETTPVVVPGEAILGIEAVARCCAAPGRRFLNLANGPYGAFFGQWLREGGAEVRDLEIPWNDVFDAQAVADALDETRPDALCYVYTEAVTGGANPARAIQAAARARGVITIVDAVSSVGADPFRMDEWGVDIVSIGMQKALLGSNGVSFLGVSERGLRWMRDNRRAPEHSALSVTELYDEERAGIPAHLPVLEARDSLRAFREIEEMGGVDALIARHRVVAERVRREAKALGFTLYQAREAACTALNTTLELPETPAAAAFSGEGIVRPGDGALFGRLLRVNHYGVNATDEAVNAALKTLAGLL